jgi:hypothetical protein
MATIRQFMSLGSSLACEVRQRITTLGVRTGGADIALAVLFLLHKILSKFGVKRCIATAFMLYSAYRAYLKAQRILYLRNQLVSFEEVRRTVVAERESLLVDEEEEYPFIYKVAAEVVLRMGGRPTTTPELKAARLLAWRIMRAGDHRIKHCEKDIPKIMILISNPTTLESITDTVMINDTFIVAKQKSEIALANLTIPGDHVFRAMSN